MKKQQTMFADVLETVTKYFLFLVAAVVLFILLSGIRVVKSGNVAVVLRFGKLVGDNYEEQVHEPGLLFAFPYFIDEVIMIPTGTVMEQSVTTHYTGDGNELSAVDGGYLITGDQNIAVVAASVKYTVSDPVAYVTHVDAISTLINATVSSAMVNEGAAMDVDTMLTDGKDDFANAIRDFAGEKLRMMGTGVTVTSIELTQVAMPEEVRESYEAVNSASVQAETVVQRAWSYRDTMLPDIESKANATVSSASAAKAKAIAAADSDLAEFWGVLEEFEKNEEYVRTRIYTDKFTAAIAKIGTVRMVQDGETKIFLNP